MDGELDAIRERLLSDVSKCSEIPEGDEMTQAKEALVVIIKHVLRSTDQDEMAEWFSGWNQINLWLFSYINKYNYRKNSESGFYELLDN